MSANFPEPREFQRTAHDKLRDGLRAGNRTQILCAPTGAGKTYMAMRLMHEAMAKGRRALFLCDRRTLIEQTSRVASRYGMDHGVIMAQHWRNFPHRPLQIGSVQTIARRGFPETDLVIVDECHTQMGAWTERIGDSKVPWIGLTATPFSPGLGRLFGGIVNAATLEQLTEAKVLKRLRVVTAHRPDMSKAKTVAGEWSDKSAGEAVLKIAGDVVAEWLARASDRKTIMFCPRVEDCEDFVRRFAERGVVAATFTGKTPDDEREKLRAEFAKDDSQIRILVSVEALAKGFDETSVNCVIDARPLRKSFSTFIQMVGRGLRSHPGQDDCLLLDHSGNVVRFAEDFEKLYREGVDSLDDGEKLDASARPEREDREATCPKCGHVPFARVCMSCGHERKRTVLREETRAEMMELDLIGAKTDKRQVYLEVASYVMERPSGDPDRDRRKIAGIYKGLTGVWPRGMDDLMHMATPGLCSRATAGKIKAQRIAWAKRRAA
jgi:DNA repair protein RadD